MVNRVKKNIIRVYGIYNEFLAILLLVLFADAAIYMIKFIPYLNWFAGLIPFVLAFLNWIILIYLFRLSSAFVFKLAVFFLFVTFVTTTVNLSQISAFLGTVVFGMIATVIIQQILDMRKSNAQD